MSDETTLNPNLKKALLTRLPDRMPFWNLDSQGHGDLSAKKNE